MSKKQKAKGRVHEIAKPRSRPVTGAPEEPAEDRPAETSERLRELVAEGVIGPIPEGDGDPASDTQLAGADVSQEKAESAETLVVFAFRLTKAERDEIHAAAGSAKASRFVRGVAVAAARGDVKVVQDFMDEVHTPVR